MRTINISTILALLVLLFTVTVAVTRAESSPDGTFNNLTVEGILQAGPDHMGVKPDDFHTFHVDPVSRKTTMQSAFIAELNDAVDLGIRRVNGSLEEPKPGLLDETVGMLYFQTWGGAEDKPQGAWGATETSPRYGRLAAIAARVAGEQTSTSRPGILNFFTTPVDSNALAERAYIDSTGYAQFHGRTPWSSAYSENYPRPDASVTMVAPPGDWTSNHRNGDLNDVKGVRTRINTTNGNFEFWPYGQGFEHGVPSLVISPRGHIGLGYAGNNETALFPSTGARAIVMTASECPEAVHDSASICYSGGALYFRQPENHGGQLLCVAGC